MAGEDLRSVDLFDGISYGGVARRPAARSKSHANIPVCDDPHYLSVGPTTGRKPQLPVHISSVAEPRLLSGPQ